MYNLPYFKEPEAAEIRGFMEAHPFVLLCGVDQHGHPSVTQVPILIEEKDDKLFLIGHISKGSDHIKAFQANPDKVMAVFTSPHAYVSATWYTNPNMGSTWNYMTVQAHGTLHFGDQEELIRVMKKLTLHYEGGNLESSTFFDNLPQDYIDKMLKGILPFSLEVTRLEHVFKLSQNRDEESFQHVIDRLSAGDAGAQFIAGEMKKRKKKLYPH